MWSGTQCSSKVFVDGVYYSLGFALLIFGIDIGLPIFPYLSDEDISNLFSVLVFV